MMNYLKNQGTWKLSQLKNLSFEEVREEFDKLVKQVESFAPINFEATKASLKIFGKEIQTKTTKRLKDDEAKDAEPTKKSGKRRKQMAIKGLHTDLDKDDSKDSDEVSEQEDSVLGTKIPINPVPILNAQTEAQKPENLENEDVGGMIRKDIPREKLEPRADEPYLKRQEFSSNSEVTQEGLVLTGYDHCLSSRDGPTKLEDIQNSRDMLRASVASTLEKLIKQRIQAARDRQKSYANLKRKPMEFQVRDKVMLRVSPWKGVLKLEKHASSVTLSEECSTTIQKNLPKKKGDPRSFTLPCLIGTLSVKNALADLGASINPMPYSFFLRLGISELKPTMMSIQLADRSIKYLIGICENILVKIDKFIFLVDFVILEMDEDASVLIILERPFLATARTFIDVHDWMLSLRVGEESVTLNIGESMKFALSWGCLYYTSRHSDELVQQQWIDTLNHDSNWINNEEENNAEEVQAASFYPRKEPIKPLEWKVPENKLKPSMEEPPKVELKALPDHLEYVFLQRDDQLLVVISSSLSPLEKNKLLKVMKSHKKAIAWGISNIKGIDPSFYTHKILMEEVYKPCVQPLKKIESKHEGVVKKDTHPRLIHWILLLQEFDIEIRDKKVVENLAADYLSRLENHEIEELNQAKIDDTFLYDTFPDESLIKLDFGLEEPWFADFTNYLGIKRITKWYDHPRKEEILF
ncbi:DNA-directed DNA polymerase [Tanacetum coccineum]